MTQNFDRVSLTFAEFFIHLGTQKIILY